MNSLWFYCLLLFWPTTDVKIFDSKIRKSEKPSTLPKRMAQSTWCGTTVRQCQNLWRNGRNMRNATTRDNTLSLKPLAWRAEAQGQDADGCTRMWTGTQNRTQTQDADTRHRNEHEQGKRKTRVRHFLHKYRLHTCTRRHAQSAVLQVET